MVRNILFLWLAGLGSSLLAQPPNFIIHHGANYPKGYLLLAPGDVKHPGQEKTFVLIMNTNGEVIYYKTLNGKHDFKLLSNGNYAVFGSNAYLIYDGAMNLIDSIGCLNGVKTDSHEFYINPDGHYILMGTEFVDRDLSMYNVFMQHNLAGSKNAKLECNVIQELDKDKNLIYSWHTHEHFNFEEVDPFYLIDTVFVGWTHMNSIDEPDNEHWLVSLKYFNQIALVHKKSGQVEWRMGGMKSTVKTLFQTPFLGQHDARMKGHSITLFDNGHSDSLHAHFACGRVFEIDDTNKTAREIKTFHPTIKVRSTRAGNFQTLSNGQYLVCYGQPEHSNHLLDIFNAKGEVDYSLSFVDTLPTYRSFFTQKIPSGFNRPNVIKKRIGKKVFLYAGHKTEEWFWSNGSRESQIELKPGQKMQLYVADGKGGFVGSKLISY